MGDVYLDACREICRQGEALMEWGITPRVARVSHSVASLGLTGRVAMRIGVIDIVTHDDDSVVVDGVRVD